MEPHPPVAGLTGRDVDRLREQLVLLSVECPHAKSNPPCCPLHDLRTMPPAEIIDWIDGLSREDQNFVALYHECCLRTMREQPCPPVPDRARRV